MATREPATPVRWPWVWLFAMLPFMGWWLTGLFDLDEGFYGAVTAEMNRRGEWITPYFNGHPWFEKPILTYWVTKPFLWLFGDQVGPRTPSILATAATFAAVIWFARRRMSDRVGAMAVLILATSLLFVALGRMLMTDPLLNLALTAGFLTFWESLVGDYRWRWATAFCLGLGVLAKGPIAILLFVPLAAWTFWREPELRPAFRKGWLVGTGILALTIASWYMPAYLANGHEFVQKFLIEQNLNRFTGGDEAHTLGGVSRWVFYVPVLLVGMAPWSVMLWWAWPKRQAPANGQQATGEDALRRYLAAWAAIVFIFFSISSAKLVHYVLPCFVPIALLVADHLEKATPARSLKPFFFGAGVACLVANAGFWIYYGNTSPVTWLRTSHQREAQDLVRELKMRSSARSSDGYSGADDRIALFQLPRRQKSLGTGKPTIQETSEPSLLMYLDRTAIETDSLDPLLSTRQPFWVFTRWNRLRGDDLAKLSSEGWSLTRVPTKTVQDVYALWRAEPR